MLVGAACGFSAAEQAALRSVSVKFIDLGMNTLRTETARGFFCGLCYLLATGAVTMNKMRPFFTAKFALPISIWSAAFSLAMLTALIFFVDDVASVLTVYFELNADQKWQIISKFKTPLLIALSSLLCFNVVTILLCTFYSARLFNMLDTMLKWLDLILVGEDRRLNPIFLFDSIGCSVTQNTTAAGGVCPQPQHQQRTPSRPENHRTLSAHTTVSRYQAAASDPASCARGSNTTQRTGGTAFSCYHRQSSVNRS